MWTRFIKTYGGTLIMSQSLQAKYNELKDNLERKKLENARLEAQLESYEKEYNKIVAEINELAKTKSLDEALEKVKALDNKIEELTKQAEELLNE